uniref:Uncharacterized protein n=1 Tax=Thermogemmatispora argillosa TaxID=2045280 RepID=A0A455T269_9CHLR|nr:hypothetical protein KTA_15900 [Thermogemmatispora argillosa]
MIDNLIQSFGCSTIDWERFLNAHGNFTVRQAKYYLEVLSQIQAVQEEATRVANQYGSDTVGNLPQRIADLLNRMLRFFFDPTVLFETIQGVAGQIKGVWYELSWIEKLCGQGQQVRGPKDQEINGVETDIDLTINGDTLVELKSSSLIGPKEIGDLLDQIERVFTYAKQHNIHTVEFYFERASIDDRIRATIEQESQATGISFQIHLGMQVDPYPRSTTWCSDPSLQTTPTPSSQPTQTPPPGSTGPGPSGPPLSTPTPTPSPSPTPRAVPTPLALP